ncbi:MAG: 3-methyl-2-oxobutanoate hydroxymethyltransferase [Gammaproteobacteria bacterium]|nr:3-methyl-2-oxobutanoate hydroxymethyltransferase [Gammaproteobacteria bacterium]
MSKKSTLNTLLELKAQKETFSCLTAYDACFSHFISTAGVEVILVGDSLGMVLQGRDSTIPVSIEDMVYHTQCVAQGNDNSLIMADMPFMTYGTPEQTLSNAAKLMRAGAELVKLEGGEWLNPSIKQLNDCGIPSCVHLGLTPQSVHKFGGYKVQGRSPEAAEQLLREAKAAQQAGAAMLLLECVPSSVGKTVTQAVDIPVIGIGAGPDTDGQVLVLHDMLGLTPHKPAKFVKNFMADANGSIQDAIAAFHSDVKTHRFPGDEHGFSA